MALGKMTRSISIVKLARTADSAGFVALSPVTLATVRASREGRQGSQKWANRASFTDATEEYRFRTIPNVIVIPGMYIYDGNEHFLIVSVNTIVGKGLYLEVLCKKEEPNGEDENNHAG